MKIALRNVHQRVNKMWLLLKGSSLGQWLMRAGIIIVENENTEHSLVGSANDVWRLGWRIRPRIYYSGVLLVYVKGYPLTTASA